MVKKTLKIISILFIATFGIAFLILSTPWAGYRAFSVMSSSMEPALKTGSLIITKHSPTLSSGDIITFINPAAKQREFITHRIQKIENDKGFVRITTKGDKNNSLDSWVLAGGGVVGKVVFSVPYIGYFMSFLKSKAGIIIFILLPALYIIFDEGRLLVSFFLKKKQPPVPLKTLSLLFIGVLGLGLFVSETRASLSDSVILSYNSFTVSADDGEDGHKCDRSIFSGNQNTGPDSLNISIAKKRCKKHVTISNLVDIMNDIFVFASTGGNSASENAGSPEASSSAVVTGDATASANVVTSANSSTVIMSLSSASVSAEATSSAD